MFQRIENCYFKGSKVVTFIQKIQVCDCRENLQFLLSQITSNRSEIQKLHKLSFEESLVLSSQNYFDKNEFYNKIKEERYIIKEDIVIHLWSCSATTELDAQYLMDNNTKYSRLIYEQCESVGARFIYASSAATYGNGKK